MSSEVFEAWARENHITFVSRSSGQHTTDTVSRDALRNLWQAATAAALDEAAKEAEHWQTISEPGHKCGEYIAGAIRALKDGAA